MRPRFPAILRRVRDHLHRASRLGQTEDTDRKILSADQALADPRRLLWVRLADVKFKVTNYTSRLVHRGDILAGDWDLHVKEIATTSKHRAIVEHFGQGIPWEDTFLFQKYRRRLSAGESVRGCTSIAEVKQLYESWIDPLFADIKENGFRTRGRDPRSLLKGIQIPHVHIGHNGNIILGNDGNHRYAIAAVLKIERMPFLVYARHADWQALRERIFAARPEMIETFLTPELADHPDLADVIARAPAPDAGRTSGR